MGIGDWGWGIGDWGLGPIPIPNPQSPIPNPQSPLKNYNFILVYVIKNIINLKNKKINYENKIYFLFNLCLKIINIKFISLLIFVLVYSSGNFEDIHSNAAEKPIFFVTEVINTSIGLFSLAINSS